MFLGCSGDHGIPVWSAVRDMHCSTQNRRGAPEGQSLGGELLHHTLKSGTKHLALLSILPLHQQNTRLQFKDADRRKIELIARDTSRPVAYGGRWIRLAHPQLRDHVGIKNKHYSSSAGLKPMLSSFGGSNSNSPPGSESMMSSRLRGFSPASL
jgi:hypothetical protein